MGYKIGSVALIVFLLIPSCILCRLSAESRVVFDHITIAGYELQLEERGAKCILIFSGHSHRGELTLSPKPPCRFVRDWKGDPQSFSYEDIGNAMIVILVGTPSKEVSSDLSKRECGTESQGVILREQGVLVSKRIGRGSLICPSHGLDETEFWLFSHEWARPYTGDSEGTSIK